MFEKATPMRLDDVAFQPSQSCELATPGRGEQLEWWHFQHKSSANLLYSEALLVELDLRGRHRPTGVLLRT